jgi:hypothetical protein
VTDLYIWSFECIIFYGDLEPKPVPGIASAPAICSGEGDEGWREYLDEAPSQLGK